MQCPSCLTELEIVAAGGVAAIEPDAAAVEIARINADKEIKLAKLAAAASESSDEHFETIAETHAVADVAVAAVESEVAAEQPALIATAIADVVGEVIGEVQEAEDASDNEEIVPLPEATVVETEPDDEPKKTHWMHRNFA